MHVHIHPVETETWRVPPPLSGADDDGLKHAMDFLPQIPASTEQTDDDWLRLDNLDAIIKEKLSAASDLNSNWTTNEGQTNQS